MNTDMVVREAGTAGVSWMVFGGMRGLQGQATGWGGRLRRALWRGSGRAAVRPGRSAVSAAPLVDNAAALFGAARSFAPRIEMDRNALDYLYASSLWPDLSREQWEDEVRTAQAVYLIMRRSDRIFPWEDLVDRKALDEAFARVESSAKASGGALLITFHSAFCNMARELFAKRCNRAVVHGGEWIVRSGRREFNNSRDAMFAALNALRDGEVVLLTPDGRKGQQSARFSVLGATATGGAGAALLAYASRCATAWFTVLRKGDGFAHAIEPGPTREDGETLAAFSDRFHAFYARKIEEVFTGDPRNIVLLWRWAGWFAQAARLKL